MAKLMRVMIVCDYGQVRGLVKGGGRYGQSDGDSSYCTRSLLTLYFVSFDTVLSLF